MDYDKNEALKLDNQLCFPLYAAARKVVAAYSPYLKPLGITYTQYILFLVLWEHDSILVSDICSRLMLDSGTVTPLLKKLEAKGYLVRERSTEDERCVYIKLTKTGRSLKEQAYDIPKQVGACVPLTADEAAALYAILHKILGCEDN